MLSILAILATTIAGLMVGIEFAVAFVLGPLMRRLPAAEFLDSRADSARLMGRMMPFWYISSLVVAIALSALAWGTPIAAVALTASGLLAAGVILSVTLLVPINNRSATWTAEHHPEDWRDQLARWDRLHIVRIAIILAAFVLIAVTATMV